jgi:hypothetical protein
MSKIVGIALAAGLLVMATGCAYNSGAGRQTVRSGVFFGDFGVMGDGNTMTAKNGSKLSKLSVIGNDNTVMVEDLVTLPHIEFWGSNNTVSVPEYLMLRVTEVGHGNKVIRRPVTFEVGAENESLYALPRRPAPMETGAGPTSRPATEPPPAEPADTGTGGSGEWIP